MPDAAEMAPLLSGCNPVIGLFGLLTIDINEIRAKEIERCNPVIGLFGLLTEE